LDKRRNCNRKEVFKVSKEVQDVRIIDSGLGIIAFMLFFIFMATDNEVQINMSCPDCGNKQEIMKK
jgi:hypothetical protein